MENEKEKRKEKRENIFISKEEKVFLINMIEDYLNVKGFGSLNKNDFEVLIISALSKGKYGLSSTFQLSRLLKIPETKVKRLRYEPVLKYCEDDERDNFIKLQKALDKAELKVGPDKNTNQFFIQNQVLANYMDEKLKEMGRVYDTSFNNEIFRVDLEDLKVLYDTITYSKEGLKDVIEEGKKILIPK